MSSAPISRILEPSLSIYVSCGSGGHNISLIPTLLHVLTFPSRDCQAIKTNDSCTGSTVPNGIKIIIKDHYLCFSFCFELREKTCFIVERNMIVQLRVLALVMIWKSPFFQKVTDNLKKTACASEKTG